MRTFQNILILSLLIFTQSLFANKCKSNNSGGGVWGNVPAWLVTCPICTDDTIYIEAGDTISILTQQDMEACTSVLLVIDGVLFFPVNGPKLKLPANSSIVISSGGLISGPGGDNSNKISIGGAWIWESNEPDVVGPFFFGVPLPVELLSFEAQLNLDEEVVQLEWATSTEINNDYFTIERSTDAIAWEEIAIISGAGNSNRNIAYSSIDNEPLQGRSYYRLRQTDFDGKASYFELRAIYFNEKESSPVTIYPNPAISDFSIEGVGIEIEKIKLYSALGQDFTNQIKLLQSSNSKIKVDLSNLKSGIYYVQTASSINKLYKQ